MATKTFLQLKTALSSMWGYESSADLLDQDLADIESYINGAYFDCYAPADGSRAYWPEQYHSGRIKASASATLTLTLGSKVVSGFTFDPVYAGSFVKIGERMFRYAGNVTDPITSVVTQSLVQAWDLPSGTYPATVYYNAVSLPWNVAEIAGVPTILGLGALTALPGADAEVFLRSGPAYDFESRSGRQPSLGPRSQFSAANYLDVGEPRFYHIDQASVAPSFTLGNRIHFYPVPDADYTFDLRASVVPISLTQDTDVPQLPAQTVDNILLPIAREKLAEATSGRRYTGPNVQLLIRAADRAREQLKSLRRVQRDGAGAVRLQRGW